MKLMILLSLILVGCADLLSYRTFSDQMEQTDERFFMPQRDFAVVPGDSGQVGLTRQEIAQRTPASYRSAQEMREQQSLSNELKTKVNDLSEWEYRRYVQALPYLENDSEKIYYLGLPANQRNHYIDQRRSSAVSQSKEQQIQVMDISERLRAPELYLGMDKDSVIQSWGRPDRVEVAGNPRNENERWVFFQQGKARYVYFEKGTVEGWAL